MAQSRLPMRKIRDVLRLSAAGLSKRQIAASLGIGPTSAGACLRRAREAGISWPLPDDLGDAALERHLYPAPAVAAKDWRSLPDWPAVHRELRRKGVTLQLVWEEYRAAHPDGYSRSRFCELYRAWEGRLSPTMRQAHVAGEKLFVDYAGTTIDVVDAATGEAHACQLFVAALGASSYTYAEATFTQTLPDWIGSHTRAFAFFDGVPAMVVSDNLRSGITKACFYEPGVNRAYAEMAAHYDTAIVPARPRKPRDKAKVEVAVQVATRWIIAKLRNAAFFSLADLNGAIRDCVTVLNDRVSRHLGSSRRTLFDTTDRPALKPLPTAPYVYAEWKQCKAGLDYHVAVHVRSSSSRKHTTVREHMPSSHRRYADWTPERIQRRANEIGPKTSALIEIILRERTHPEQGFRATIGILRHATSFGYERLEAACARALEIGARSYTSVTSILKTNLDRRRPDPATDGPAIVHSNIRGPRYFH